MANDFALLSPEKTVLTYRLAGLGSRISAHLLDLAFVVCLIVGILVFGTYLYTSGSTGIGKSIISVAPPLSAFLYFILLEGLCGGQTLGKRLCRLRVRMEDGTPATFQAALGRNLLRPADMLPGTYLVGLLAMFAGPKGQRLGDLAAGTVVVSEKRPNIPIGKAPHAAGIHRMEEYVGNLRGMTMEEYAALRRLCDRFPNFDIAMQERLMAEVWAPIAARRNIATPPGVHGLYMVEATVMKYGREHGML